MNEYKRPVIKKNTYIKLSLIFILLSVVIATFSFEYYKTLSKTLEEESKTYLSEISNQIGANVDRIIKDNLVMLKIIGVSLEHKGQVSKEEIRKLLSDQNSHLNFDDIILIDSEGKGYNLQSNDIALRFDKQVRESILVGEEFVSTTQMINNKEYVVFSVPLKGVELLDRKMVSIVGKYDAKSFEQVLSMSSFNEKAYSQLITESGTIVTKPTSKYVIGAGYNIFASLEKAKFNFEHSIEKVKKDIKNKQTGKVEFSINKDHRYMTYTPIKYNNWYLLTFVPADIIDQRSAKLLKDTLVICAMVAIIFSTLLVALYHTFKRNEQKLEDIAFVDMVTKGNTIQKLYKDMAYFLDTYPKMNYAVLYTNIEKFKVFNEVMGRENGDKFLKFFDECVSQNLSDKESIGRISADNFCIILEYESKKNLLERFALWHEYANSYVEENKLNWVLPVIQIGIYIVEDKELSVSQIVDRAKLSLRETVVYYDSKIHYAFYDEKVREALLREKYLEDRMEKALEDQEFKVFLQPKYKLPEEKIGGCEALSRWIKKDGTMIYPSEFIPLFEKNSFIIKLDIWIFEKVCSLIRSWLDMGLKPIKISVNCSRVQLRNADFLEKYTLIADSYNIDRSFIELEITETMVFENSNTLMEIIKSIKDAGFGCSMDDFGSGYSSLNLIQSVPVDTLKIDRIFFKKVDKREEEKTEAVVSSIVRMAKSLKMQTVAEGVEERAQVDMLNRAGCDYIQGYVFAKPMSIKEFEKLAFGREISK